MSGNTAASGSGGGLANFGPGATATLTNCTVSGNSASYGGGLSSNDSPLLVTSLRNTIVAGNTTSGGSASDISGEASGSYNLIGTGGSGGLINGIDNNQVGVANPLLGKPGSYGGPTPTIPLLPGSPAIDAGTSAGIPAADQRGLPRVGGVDIGAFEAQGFSLSGSPTSQVATAGTPFASATDRLRHAGPRRGPGGWRAGHVHRAGLGSQARRSGPPDR